MRAFFFSAGSRRLFGHYHARAEGLAPRRAVLLCSAFGRESIRAHRLYRVVADRLARNGCDVLRFDYSCTGDSAGDEADASLATWHDDVRAAHAELQDRSQAPSVVWFGMRFGALVAQQAVRRDLAPSRLVMWDPVVDGRDYLALLRSRHLERRVASEDGEPTQPDVFHQQPDFYIDEAIGFLISRALCDELRHSRFSATVDVRTDVIIDPGTDDGRAVRRLGALPPNFSVTELTHSTDWTSNRDASGLVPAPALNHLISNLGAA